MKAKVTKEFAGVKDGMVHPRTWLVDDEVEGDLAWNAVNAGNAEWTKDGKPTKDDEERYAAQVRTAPVAPRASNVTGTALEDFKEEAAASAQEQRGDRPAKEKGNVFVPGPGKTGPAPDEHEGEVEAADEGRAKATKDAGKTTMGAGRKK